VVPVGNQRRGPDEPEVLSSIALLQVELTHRKLSDRERCGVNSIERVKTRCVFIWTDTFSEIGLMWT
jgi:hypothetical protein